MEPKLKVTAPASVKELADQVISMGRNIPSLYPMAKSESQSSLSSLLKKEVLNKDASSKQGAGLGLKPHPFDFYATTKFQTSNVHHSACVRTKTSSMVGLGFKRPEESSGPVASNLGSQGTNTPAVQLGQGQGDRELRTKVDDLLNPLCDVSIQDVLTQWAEDFWQVGNGLIEVVRRGGTPRTSSSPGAASRTTGEEITGLHHIPAYQARVYVEDFAYSRHYVICASDEEGEERHFALFGDKQNFLERIKRNSLPGDMPKDLNPDQVSEVIVLRQPSTLSRWYGFPQWLAAVASIELVQCLHQWKYDFFLNRGVPEFLLFVMGQKLDPKTWAKIEEALQAHVGLGNSHKSSAINLDNPEIKVQIEKLAMDGTQEDDFSGTKDNLALDIVTAHQVPPLLAGIQIPGKLGASNEMVNSLVGFQLLVVGPAQRLAQQVLGNTLGNASANGGLDLTPDDFHFRSITDMINLGAMDTISRQRTPAVNNDRDPGEGLRD